MNKMYVIIHNSDDHSYIDDVSFNSYRNASIYLLAQGFKVTYDYDDILGYDLIFLDKYSSPTIISEVTIGD